MESKLNQYVREINLGVKSPLSYSIYPESSTLVGTLRTNTVYMYCYTRLTQRHYWLGHKNQYKRSTFGRGRAVFQFNFFNLFSCNLRIMEEGVSLHFLLRDRVLSILGRYSKKTSTILWLVLGLQTYSWVCPWFYTNVVGTARNKVRS